MLARSRANRHQLPDGPARLTGAGIAMPRPTKQVFGQSTREVAWFLIVGIANTALTFAVFLTLLRTVPYGWAFTVAFVCGLIFQTAMKIRVVFSSVITARRVSRYVVYSCTYFALNLLFLRVLVETGGVSPAIASFITLCLMTPIHFLASRLIIAPDLREIVPRAQKQQDASP